MIDPEDDVISAEEVEHVLGALRQGQGAATPEECERALRWVRRTRLNAVILDLVLSSAVTMRWPDPDREPDRRPACEQPCCSRPVFTAREFSPGDRDDRN